MNLKCINLNLLKGNLPIIDTNNGYNNKYNQIFNQYQNTSKYTNTFNHKQLRYWVIYQNINKIKRNQFTKYDNIMNLISLEV